MDTIYVVLSYDSKSVEAVAAFSEAEEAEDEIIRLTRQNEDAKWYNYVSVEWRG